MQEQKTGESPFIRKLYEILQSPTFHSIIFWESEACNIVILDDALLENTILARYFRHTKMESFVRQLNLYGFRKIKKCEVKKFKHQLVHELQDLMKVVSQRKDRGGRKDKDSQSPEQQELIEENKTISSPVNRTQGQELQISSMVQYPQTYMMQPFFYYPFQQTCMAMPLPMNGAFVGQDPYFIRGDNF